uniref:A-kinase anchoring protein 9 n=1 Tax=Oryzias latipes TaxID=8090 RepID=A0A3P9HNZ9_ORYLA
MCGGSLWFCVLISLVVYHQSCVVMSGSSLWFCVLTSVEVLSQFCVLMSGGSLSVLCSHVWRFSVVLCSHIFGGSPSVRCSHVCGGSLSVLCSNVCGGSPSVVLCCHIFGVSPSVLCSHVWRFSVKRFSVFSLNVTSNVQLQDFEDALKQRDGIITQLTSNLQQAREEKDEIMKEFLALTDESKKLHLQFQQLQAGETLRNSSHSSTAADLFQARQQLLQNQQQLEERALEVRKHQDRSREQLELISQLEHKLSQAEMTGRRSEESFLQKMEEKELLIAEHEKVLLKSELKLCLQELEDTTSKLVACQSDVESCKLQLEKGQMELQSCKSELAASKEKERKSSGEIMQLMGTVEDLQKRCHQGGGSDSHSIQKVQEEKVKSLELLRAELDEQYGQQIVQMKQEVNLQHAARVQQMVEEHQAEIELLKAQQLSSRSTDIHAEVESLNAQIKELKETLEQSQMMHSQTSLELSHVLQERFKLQAQVQDLLRDRDAAEARAEQVSHQIVSQERKQLLQLQETIRSLRSQLSAAQEATQEAEAKHESEITNYKIKLEMLEREKDAVLDRMAESQEAELERLRTHLLFSHEEELTNLREGLQRENFLNTENLLNEAAVKHQAALEELGRTHAEDMLLLQQEKESFAVERDELLHQILALKEDLKLALHSSKADDLVLQLQELQLELEELRKRAQERAQLQQEVQTLLTKMEMLENQTKDREAFWENKLDVLESEKETLIEELQVKQRRVEALTAENAQMQQHAAELREEVEKQKTTFSFAEKNFEVNYQELKEEYTCLIQTKTLLEERTRRETLEFEARIALLQTQIQELQRSSRDGLDEAQTEKDSSELMEKLHVTLNEKRSLEERLREVSEQFMSAQRTVQQLQEELKNAAEENVKLIKQNESLQEEMRRKQLRGKEEEQSAESQAAEDLHPHVQPLQEEIESLQERDRLQQAPELHRLSRTPSPAPLPSEEGPVEGQPPPHKPAGGGSNRRKRRQRSKQERRAAPPQREEENTMEEDGAAGAAGRAGEEDLTDGYQGDGVSAAVSTAVHLLQTCTLTHARTCTLTLTCTLTHSCLLFASSSQSV